MLTNWFTKVLVTLVACCTFSPAWAFPAQVSLLSTGQVMNPFGKTLVRLAVGIPAVNSTTSMSRVLADILNARLAELNAELISGVQSNKITHDELDVLKPQLVQISDELAAAELGPNSLSFEKAVQLGRSLDTLKDRICFSTGTIMTPILLVDSGYQVFSVSSTILSSLP